MRKAFISLLALAALASCTQSDLLEPSTDNGKVEVKLASAVTDIEVETTRTPITEVSSLASKVLLSKATGDYTTTNLLYGGTMTFTAAGTATSFDTPQYYPADGSTVYLCGLYPATNWTMGSTASTTADYTFDGKTDVMAAAEKSSTKTDGQEGGTPKELAFNHLLTNVIVKAVADTDGGKVTAAKVQEVWGKIKTITLSEAGGSTTLKNKVTVNLKAGTAPTATAFTTGTAPAFYKADGANTYTYTDNLFSAIDIPTATTAIAYSMIAPIMVDGTAGKSEFKLKITTEKETTAKELSIDLTKETGVTTDDMQGRQCVITLSFKATEIKATASVTAWEKGGTATVSVQ